MKIRHETKREEKARLNVTYSERKKEGWLKWLKRIYLDLKQSYIGSLH